jgi:hypothetical protein
MSLLTNEQIAELIGIASNQSTSMDLYEEFHEWNKKQTGVQVNVDWGKAPECAERVEVNFYWVGEDTWRFCFQIAKYDRPKPVITPHPHAEMIMKYAEVAQRRDDPWVEFEVRHTYAPSNSWFKMDTNRWISSSPDFEYRHIGEKENA